MSDGFAPQTNVVRQDGRRGVLVSILKAGTASTIDVVNGIRGMLSRVEQTLPPQLHIRPLADQSIFVKAAVAGVIRETVIAACLTALMMLLFLGSWRRYHHCDLHPIVHLDICDGAQFSRSDHQHHDIGWPGAGGGHLGG